MLSATLIESSLLLAQQVGNPVVRDTTAGRSLIGAHIGAQPCRQSACPGPPDLANLHAGPRRSSGCGDGPVGTRDAPATTSAPAHGARRISHQHTRDWTSERMGRSATDECASGAAEPPVIAAFLELRVPTSRVVAGPGSSPLQPPPGGSCRTSTAPSPPGSIGRGLDQRRTRQARRHGSDRRPPQRGRQVLPAVRGGSPRPPSAPLVAPTCRTRVRGYSARIHRSGFGARFRVVVRLLVSLLGWQQVGSAVTGLRLVRGLWLGGPG
jgi:hypothetical protein